MHTERLDDASEVDFLMANISLGTDTQQQDAAARRLLRAGQL
ncbi:hypothetical protein MIZ03_1010 [Rhodoferax lithotrophicus]|uniref:Uncharacterized protein n=1 Tax=Rhodoferax lithotrophicus TaxID=2798804 RepID=A0ABN6D2C2_9BURK|nr:hypothetical protein MIZ03_1010 [Rhodoferax sp. MIZ03]